MSATIGTGENRQMFRKIMVFSAFTAGMAAFAAQASTPADEPTAPRIEAGVMLAQSGDIEIYVDEFGRRVLVDAYTGEVISVEPPRRVLRRPRRERQERYYLDDPEDMERLRRDRMRELGRVPSTGDYEYYDNQREALREARPEVFPDQPEPNFAEPDFADPDFAEPEQPEVVTRAPIERAPLNEGSVVRPETPETPTIVVEEPREPSMAFTAREEVAALQILLDRAGASPGVIDGKFGSKVDKAIIGYRAITGENLRSTDAEGIKKALQETGGDPFTTYTISATDAAGPFVASVPEDYSEKAKLQRLGYTSVSEMLAEKFHMDEAYLKSLNPEANFGRAGTIIRVANTGKPVVAKVARIVADKTKKQVRAYDAEDKLIAVYPATIGSSDTPSPTGTHAVSRVAFDPEYTYNPKVNFKQGQNDKILTIPPGPNGPVGSIWIALDKPTYGIHGTPEPSTIGKTESHGCVRLTNWDAKELAEIVDAGVPVEFAE
jgi:lipoprotein-anchoring transpeptidase ErfK/SrfK